MTRWTVGSGLLAAAVAGLAAVQAPRPVPEDAYRANNIGLAYLEQYRLPRGGHELRTRSAGRARSRDRAVEPGARPLLQRKSRAGAARGRRGARELSRSGACALPAWSDRPRCRSVRRRARPLSGSSAAGRGGFRRRDQHRPDPSSRSTVHGGARRFCRRGCGRTLQRHRGIWPRNGAHPQWRARTRRGRHGAVRAPPRQRLRDHALAQLPRAGTLCRGYCVDWRRTGPRG